MRPLLLWPVVGVLLLGAALGQEGAALASGGAASPGVLGAFGDPLLGGIASGDRVPGVLPLSLGEALGRGRRYNLGVLLSGRGVEASRGARIQALGRLLPQLTAGVTERRQQVNLAAFGLEGAPGAKRVVGPFDVFDARAEASQVLLDLPALNQYRAARELHEAARLEEENTRDTVAYVCAALYYQAVASRSRIDSVRAQVDTARALYDLAVSQKAAGVVSGIEVLRAQVQLEAERQRLIVAGDQFAKDKLSLARAIGLPLGQEFDLVDGLDYRPIATPPLEETIGRARREREDYAGAAARVRAAESERKAALAARLPTVGVTADYGVIGPAPDRSHGTFTVAANVRLPIFLGGSIRGRVAAAEAALAARRAELEDLEGSLYYEIRKAFLDLGAAAERVEVAGSAVGLAEEQVRQSRDRFAAGVTNNVEVVQAQEAYATASENRIAGLFAHTLAKLALARATGVHDGAYERFLRGGE